MNVESVEMKSYTIKGDMEISESAMVALGHVGTTRKSFEVQKSV